MNSLIRFFVVLSLILIARQQQCYPNFNIDKKIQNSVSLQFSEVEKSSIQFTKSYIHPFWGNMFTQKPSIAYCISDLAFKPTKQMKYSLQTKVNQNSIQFTLTSKGIYWTILDIRLWLFDRKDLFVQKFQFVPSSNNRITNEHYFLETKLLLPSQLVPQASTMIQSFIYQVFLTGLQSSVKDSSAHLIKISDTYAPGDSTLRIQIQTELNNKILGVKFLVVAVPIQTSELIGYEVDFTYEQLKETFQLLNGRFNPVFNILLGLKSFSSKINETFSLKQSYDLPNSYVKIFSQSTPIKKIDLSFLAISRIMSKVCSPCTHSFIQFDKCRSDTKCAEGYFEKAYYDSKGVFSGKTCVKCLSQVNMEYNSQMKSCICKKDFSLTTFGTNCLSKVNESRQNNSKRKVQCPIQGMIYSQGKCQCSEFFVQINGKCSKCPQQTTYDQTLSKCITKCSGENQIPSKYINQCICKQGFQKVNKVCKSKCGVNSERDLKTGSCVCKSGFEMVSKTEQCVKKCGKNQFRSNNVCLCLAGFSLNKVTNKCQMASEKVNNLVKSETTPNKTSQNQQLPTTKQEKRSPQTKSNQKLPNPVKTQLTSEPEKIHLSLIPSTPIFANPGIIIEFQITPIIAHTQDEVQKMFSMTFSDNSLAPPTVYINQNENNLKQYRVFFDYRNNLPYKKFSVTFKVKDPVHGEDSFILHIDPLSTSITSANKVDNVFIGFNH